MVRYSSGKIRKGLWLALLSAALPLICGVTIWIVVGERPEREYFLHDYITVGGHVARGGFIVNSTSFQQYWIAKEMKLHLETIPAKRPNYLPTTRPDNDVTILRYQLKLFDWTSSKNRKDAMIALWYRIRYGGYFPVRATVSEKLLSESPVLFVRATPQREYYVSTAEDWDHHVSGKIIMTDSDVWAQFADKISDYLVPWTHEADALMPRARE
jgi:hypothetical protein